MTPLLPRIERLALVAGLVLAVGVTAWPWVQLVSARHEARDLRAALCRAELRALRASNPMLDRFVMPGEPCMVLQILLAEGK